MDFFFHYPFLVGKVRKLSFPAIFICNELNSPTTPDLRNIRLLLDIEPFLIFEAAIKSCSLYRNHINYKIFQYSLKLFLKANMKKLYYYPLDNIFKILY